VSTDSEWADHLSSDTPATVTAAAAAHSEVTAAANDQDWSDWHATQGDSWSSSSDWYVQQAQENVAAGNYDAAASNLDSAATHADIADSNYQSATGYSADAATHLDNAAEYGTAE
jgi:hypothetical protein